MLNPPTRDLSRHKPQSTGEGPVDSIPVLRPQLPSADRILAYLRRIDSARIYSNWGPLCAEFQDRICAQLMLPGGAFVVASSGTSALMGAILAVAGPAKSKRPVALMPAFTFVATAIAAERCGYKPCFQDISPESWMLDPEDLEKHPLIDRVGIVIPVAPFGKPVRQRPWAAFQEKTGIPVIIDGAASFDRIMESPAEFIGTIPLALSFHATKSFGMGEGGGIAVTDMAISCRLEQALNFGFCGTRDSSSASLNGKLSEYHAAVGLAELDGWSSKAAELRDLAYRYSCKLTQFDLLDRLIVTPLISSCYALFKCSCKPEVQRVQQSLKQAAVDFRMWYGSGVHCHNHFSHDERGSLPMTEDILQCLIGIPVAIDLSDTEIARVAAALARGVHTDKMPI